MLLVLRLSPFFAVLFALLSVHAAYKMKWKSINRFGIVAIAASLITWFGIGLAPPPVLYLARSVAVIMPFFLWYVERRYGARRKMFVQISEILDKQDEEDVDGSQ